MHAAVEDAKSSGRTPEQVLMEWGALTSEQLARATAERFGLDHVDLTVFKPDLGALNLVNAQAARRYNAVPIGFDDGVCWWKSGARRSVGAASYCGTRIVDVAISRNDVVPSASKSATIASVSVALPK